jgi:hypothetical protein
MPVRRVASLWSLSAVVAVAVVVATAAASVPRSSPRLGAARGHAVPAAVDTALVAQERSLYEALRRHGPAAFNTALGADFVFVDDAGATQWQRSMTASVLQRCQLGRFAMDDVRTTRAGDVAVVTFTWTGDETCDGHASPSPVRVMSVWRRRGRWVAVSHSETPVASGSS